MKETFSQPSNIGKSEPVEIFEKHKNLFEQYAGHGIKVELAPKGLDTFAFDLEKNTIYLSPRFYIDKFTNDESDRFTVFAILHEIGHFKEKLEILKEQNGIEDFKKYLERLKKDKAFAMTDNLIADISINREVVDKTNSEFRTREQDVYKKDLFPTNDFTDAPKHIQFPQALLREHRLPDEECIVDPLVRKELDKIYKNEKGNIVDIMTNPDIPMSTRLKILDKYIMPIVDKLKKQDIEDKNSKDKDDEQKEKSEESDESAESGEDNQNNDPNEMFKKDYEKAEKGMMGPVSDAEIERAMEKALEDFLEKNPEAKSLKQEKTEKEIKKDMEEQEAKELGVDVKDLRDYNQTKDSLEKILDEETQKSIIEELSNLFSRIISKRKSDRWSSKAPVDEGPYLADPANLIADVKSGTLRSYSWEDVHKKPKESNKYGEIELSFIFDRSGSMNEDQKDIEQRKAAILIMEALSDFENQLKNAKRSGNLNQELTMKNEIFSFQSSSEDKTPLKSLSSKLTEKEKIQIAEKLSSTGGGTTDFIPLNTINESIDEKDIKKMKDGKLKKIVIVMTDGGSDNKTAVKKELEGLRKKGVIVIGVGITESGAPAIETYSPSAVLVKEAKDLTAALVNTLKEHLANI